MKIPTRNLATIQSRARAAESIGRVSSREATECGGRIAHGGIVAPDGPAAYRCEVGVSPPGAAESPGIKTAVGHSGHAGHARHITWIVAQLLAVMDEDRWIGLGMFPNGIEVVVVFNEPADDLTRIISARRATRDERKRYQEEIEY